MSVVDYTCEYLKGNMTLKETLEYITKKIKEEAWEEAMKIYCPKYHQMSIIIDDIIDKEFEPYQTEMYNDFWNDYKNNLPLWSNINTNCYFKLKEN